MFNSLKQKKLIFNFFVDRNWKKLTDSRERAKILADNRKSDHTIETGSVNTSVTVYHWFLLLFCFECAFIFVASNIQANC